MKQDNSHARTTESTPSVSAPRKLFASGSAFIAGFGSVQSKILESHIAANRRWLERFHAEVENPLEVKSEFAKTNSPREKDTAYDERLAKPVDGSAGDAESALEDSLNLVEAGIKVLVDGMDRRNPAATRSESTAFL